MTSSAPRTALAFDVGGTKISAGVVAPDGRVLDRERIATPPDAGADETVALLAGLAAGLRARHPDVAAIGVGAPGMVEWPSGRIAFAPNNAYRDLRLKERLAAETGLPVNVENDANAAAWAEARYGAGAGCRDLVVLTVGTGIGGGLVLNGALYRGRTGLGAEIGHTIVNPAGGHACGCGATGCLEAEASGSALGRLGAEAAAEDPGGLIATLAGDAGRVTGETVFAAAQKGDATACALFDEVGTWLGVGIASMVNVFEPEKVVVGGGLAETGDHLLRPARAAFERFVFARDLRPLPELVPAALGNEAGLVGAAALALLALDGPA
ncbi:ROK family glucokinase [Spirillospora sp. NPDC127200]